MCSFKKKILNKQSGVPTHLKKTLNKQSGVPTHLNKTLNKQSGVPTHLNITLNKQSGVTTHLEKHSTNSQVSQHIELNTQQTVRCPNTFK